jgi:4-hydroxybenzoate polyprenyltransferase
MDMSPGYLIATLVTSTVGFSLFLYGKKQTRVPQLAVGATLMVLPYFGGGAWWIAGASLFLVAGMMVAVRRGL